MKCPRCGSATRVLYTDDEGATVKRRRMCLTEHHRFNTFEVVDSEQPHPASVSERRNWVTARHVEAQQLREAKRTAMRALKEVILASDKSAKELAIELGCSLAFVYTTRKEGLRWKKF